MTIVFICGWIRWCWRAPRLWVKKKAITLPTTPPKEKTQKVKEENGYHSHYGIRMVQIKCKWTRTKDEARNLSGLPPGAALCMIYPLPGIKHTKYVSKDITHSFREQKMSLAENMRKGGSGHQLCVVYGITIAKRSSFRKIRFIIIFCFPDSLQSAPSVLVWIFHVAFKSSPFVPFCDKLPAVIQSWVSRYRVQLYAQLLLLELARPTSVRLCWGKQIIFWTPIKASKLNNLCLEINYVTCLC